MLKSVVLSIVVVSVASSPATTVAPVNNRRVETIRTARGALARSVNDLVESHTEFSGALLIEASGVVVLDAGYGFALAENCTDSDFTLVTLRRLEAFCAAKPLANARGRFHYSNLGFSFLAAVVQHLTGRPFETALRNTILSPYGLTRTGYTFSKEDLQHPKKTSRLRLVVCRVTTGI